MGEWQSKAGSAAVDYDIAAELGSGRSYRPEQVCVQLVITFIRPPEKGKIRNKVKGNKLQQRVFCDLT